ncbi:hypothetical protein PoB_000200400 [Plakobranchus ocellatus]|uniref:Uncharacterized protein n=1 Tax=Plakobranchus ocellatus TaxID=259542 RepID=A0AAV3XZY3_9GAST|nr:hypothetical protein PoB_000200400 [Plakobranchus ocellatus]
MKYRLQGVFAIPASPTPPDCSTSTPTGPHADYYRNAKRKIPSQGRMNPTQAPAREFQPATTLSLVVSHQCD